MNFSYNFYVLGVNYKKANSKIRDKFSLDNKTCSLLLNTAKEKGLKSIFVISTCNRTEIYTTSANYKKLYNLFCSCSKVSSDYLKKYSFLYQGIEAIDHFYKVACGINSQIIGDYEIIGQIKEAINRSKKLGLIDSFSQKLINNVIATSREIKNKTNICSGKTSVSYAAVDYLRKNFDDANEKKIIVYGIGKIGKKVCLNLLKYFDKKNISIINRSFDNTKDFCQRYKLKFTPITKLKASIQTNDILILCTRANEYLINSKLVEGTKKLFIIDLSMPLNIDPEVKMLKNISILELDEISTKINLNLNNRLKEMPLALKIIEDNKNKLLELLNNYEFNNIVYNLKMKLTQIQENEIRKQQKKLDDINTEHINIVSSNIINKITGKFATNINKNPKYLKVIGEIFNI